MPDTRNARTLEKSAPDVRPHLLSRSELIHRLATEMRIRSGGELPHMFCVDQVKRQLAGKPVDLTAANDAPGLPAQASVETRSVFHAWALAE